VTSQLALGDRVEVVEPFEPFNSNSKPPVIFGVGESGIVLEIHKDGDALVGFEGQEHEWVKQKDFNKLRKELRSSGNMQSKTNTLQRGATAVLTESTAHLEDFFTEFHESIEESVKKEHAEMLGHHSFPTMFLILLVRIHPMTSILERSLLMPRAVRAMLAAAKSFGALASSAYFFAASGSAFSEAADPMCVTEGVAAALVKSCFIGFGSFIISGLPLVVLVSLHTRNMTYVKSDEEAKKILRKWEVKKSILWVVAAVYTLLCMTYVVSFQANVTSTDSLKWCTSAMSSLFNSWILVPSVIALSMASLGRLAASSPTIHEMSAQHLHKVNNQMELEPLDEDMIDAAVLEGTIHDKCLEDEVAGLAAIIDIVDKTVADPTRQGTPPKPAGFRKQVSVEKNGKEDVGVIGGRYRMAAEARQASKHTFTLEA